MREINISCIILFYNYFLKFILKIYFREAAVSKPFLRMITLAANEVGNELLITTKPKTAMIDGSEVKSVKKKRMKNPGASVTLKSPLRRSKLNPRKAAKTGYKFAHFPR